MSDGPQRRAWMNNSNIGQRTTGPGELNRELHLIGSSLSKNVISTIATERFILEKP